MKNNMSKIRPVSMPQKPRFRGIRLPKEYQNAIQESVEEDMRDPEDQGQADIPNRLKKFGGNFNG